MQHVLQHVIVAGLEFEFDFAFEAVELVQAHCSVAPSPNAPDTYLVRFSAASPGGEPFSLGELTVRWQIPIVDLHGFFGGPLG